MPGAESVGALSVPLEQCIGDTQAHCQAIKKGPKGPWRSINQIPDEIGEVISERVKLPLGFGR